MDLQHRKVTLLNNAVAAELHTDMIYGRRLKKVRRITDAALIIRVIMP